MNAKLLRDAVSRFGDDPVGIGHFRKVMIGLAIGGKLTGDGDPLPPEKMLAQIEEEKSRLLRGGQISRLKRYGPVAEEQLPEVFSDPSSFVPLGSIARIEKGLTGIQGAKSGSFPLVVTAAERGSCDHFDFEGAATIVPLVSSTGHGHASINRLHYQEGRFALGTILAAIFPVAPNLISARFIFEYLSTFKEELLVSRMTGTANVTLSVGRIAEVPVPLICPNIQRKTDELMVLCDQLEATRTEREAARDTFTLSTLAKLSTPDPETFDGDARFALANLAPLTTRPDQIRQLRQSILNLAVRGKLVEQDAIDEPARVLLKRTGDDIEDYCSGNRVARAKPEPLTEDAVSFRAPAGWSWVRLCQLFRVITDGDHQPPPRADQGIAFLTIGNVTTGRLDFNGCRLVPESYFRALPPYRTPARGDILYTVVGATFGRPALVDSDREFCVQRHIAILKPAKTMEIRFLLLLLASPLVYDQAASSTTGTAQPTIALRPLRNFAVPVPPLAEQRRIVAKVDELIALCDQLEASIITGEQTRSRLLEAVLHNALAPA